jgi:hypothetical protein
MILFDAGIIPVLVDLLALEGLKNTKIVANSLYSLNVLALGLSCELELSNVYGLAKKLEALYRTDNKVYQQFAAEVVCKIFNQLSNIGREANLVNGVQDRRASSVSVTSPQPPTGSPSTPGGLSTSKEESPLGLLVRLLDSENPRTVSSPPPPREAGMSLLPLLTFIFFARRSSSRSARSRRSRTTLTTSSRSASCPSRACSGASSRA